VSAEIRAAVDAVLTGADDPALAVVRLEADGWAAVGIDETLGGAGGTIVDAAAVAAAIAAGGAVADIGDRTVVSGWLLAHAGIALPDDGAVAAWCDPAGQLIDGHLTARADRIPYGRAATHHLIVLPDPDGRARVALVSARVSTTEPGENIAGEPRDSVSLDGAPVIATVIVDRPWTDVDRDLGRLGALLRSVQIAGAIERSLDLSARYSLERVQFGKPISSFQAVQHLLAELVGERAAAAAAARLAIETVAAQGPSTDAAAAAVAVAKIRTAQAATAAARIAHQVHGAIGVTREHSLHRTTRSLWSWRDEYGGPAVWSRRLGDLAAARTDDLWTWLTTLDDTTPAGAS